MAHQIKIGRDLTHQPRAFNAMMVMEKGMINEVRHKEVIAHRINCQSGTYFSVGRGIHRRGSKKGSGVREA